MSQKSCPACAILLPDDPGALGWIKVGSLWWCPLHAFGEQRRLKAQERELRWYDENIRLKKAALERTDADRERLLAYARVHKVYKKDPELQRRMTAIDIRADRLREDIVVLQRNRDEAVQRHQRS